jgi:hypothetical protein
VKSLQKKNAKMAEKDAAVALPKLTLRQVLPEVSVLRMKNGFSSAESNCCLQITPKREDLQIGIITCSP